MEGDGRSAPGLQLDEMDCDLEGLVRRRADSGLVARWTSYLSARGGAGIIRRGLVLAGAEAGLI